MSTPTHLYRYTDQPYGELDEYENVTCISIKVRLDTYTVIRETPCGHHIVGYGEKRWVNKSSKKRYAYPTRDEAWTAFKARKRRQVAILTINLKLAQQALNLTQPKDQ